MFLFLVRRATSSANLKSASVSLSMFRPNVMPDYWKIVTDAAVKKLG